MNFSNIWKSFFLSFFLWDFFLFSPLFLFDFFSLFVSLYFFLSFLFFLSFYLVCLSFFLSVFVFQSFCLSVSLSHCLLVCLSLFFFVGLGLTFFLFIFCPSFYSIDPKFSGNCDTLPDSSGQHFFFSSEQSLTLKNVPSCSFWFSESL